MRTTLKKPPTDAVFQIWQARGESNTQPVVLETTALTIRATGLKNLKIKM